MDPNSDLSLLCAKLQELVCEQGAISNRVAIEAELRAMYERLMLATTETQLPVPPPRPPFLPLPLPLEDFPLLHQLVAEMRDNMRQPDLRHALDLASVAVPIPPLRHCVVVELSTSNDSTPTNRSPSFIGHPSPSNTEGTNNALVMQIDGLFNHSPKASTHHLAAIISLKRIVSTSQQVRFVIPIPLGVNGTAPILDILESLETIFKPSLPDVEDYLRSACGQIIFLFRGTREQVALEQQRFQTEMLDSRARNPLHLRTMLISRLAQCLFNPDYAIFPPEPTNQDDVQANLLRRLVCDPNSGWIHMFFIDPIRHHFAKQNASSSSFEELDGYGKANRGESHQCSARR